MADKLVQLDPNDILADDNSRFGLKKYRMERLAAEIVAAGGVTTPIEVEPLPKNHPSNKSYRLTAGFYRHAAVTHLNENGGAGLLLPAMVHVVDTPLNRLKRQLSENMERENQSPMDKAIAIARLMNENVPALDIRKIFATPGGRKGMTIQPASGSFISMHLSFLDFPKPIQAKIHDGLIGVAAAYELSKVPLDKRQAVLDRIEAERIAEIDRAEAAETKFLEQEKKISEAGEKVEAIAKEAEDVSKEAESAATVLAEASKTHEAAINASVDAFKAKSKIGLTPEEKKAAEAAYKVTMEAAKEAEKNQKDADSSKKAAEKVAEKLKTAKERAQANAEKLAAARRGRPSRAEAPEAGSASPAEVRRAVGQTPGAGTGPVPLNATEMRKVVEELTLPGPYDQVREIGKIFKACFSGATTPSQLLTELAKVTGEYKPKGAAAAKKK
ncbi:MAG: hypothetical protein ACREJN_16170 [Nitrospiraceae bacterium]